MLSLLGTILLFLFILTILVVIHELGHFAVARVFKIRVEEFGIGFPPRAFSFMRGDTKWSINWLPLGGFVRLKGEQGESSADSDSFASKPVWQRLCVLAAGVAMNLLLTILIFTVGFVLGMPQVLDENSDISGARDVGVQITGVVSGSPAQKAGIKAGDTIVSLDGVRIEQVSYVQESVRERLGQPVSFIISREKKEQTVVVTPEMLAETKRPGVGVSLARVGTLSYPIHVALAKSVQLTWRLSVTIVSMLGNAISKMAFDGFVGPVGIAATTATVTKLGFSYLLNLVAQLSLSLAIFNFLPIPALDGGRALFTVTEKIFGRKMKPAIENVIHLAGFALLLALLIAVTLRDIAKLIPS